MLRLRCAGEELAIVPHELTFDSSSGCASATSFDGLTALLSTVVGTSDAGACCPERCVVVVLPHGATALSGIVVKSDGDYFSPGDVLVSSVLGWSHQVCASSLTCTVGLKRGVLLFLVGHVQRITVVQTSDCVARCE